MKDTGLSAEEATKKINELIDSTQQLSAMKTGITAITSAYDEKKEAKDRRIGDDTLKSMRNTLGIDDSWSKKDLQVWEDYKDAATDTSISLKNFKEYQDALASSYINSNNFLANLTTEKQSYYDSLLTEMGITNAHAITTKLLAESIKYSGEQEDFAAQKGKELTDATSDEIQQFIEEQGGADNASNALLKLALQKELCNDHVLDFSGDCTNLLAYVRGIGGATNALEALQAAQNHDWERVKELGYDPESTALISQLTKDAEKAANKAIKKQVKTKTKAKTTSGNKSDDTTNNKTDNNPKPKETKQAFDWLERRISVLTDSLDLLKAKIENVFSANKKNSFIDQEIKKTNTLINTYKKQAKVYKKQAKKSAKSKLTVSGEDKERLPKSLQKQIQSGKLKGSRKQWIKAYGEPTAKAIEEYQKYWEQYQKARTNIQSAKTSKRELKIEKHQNKLDKYNALSEKYDAQIKNAATAKDKNDLEDKKIDSTQKSYQQQIQIAKLKYGKNSAQVAELRAEKTSTVRDIKIEKQENIQNEADAYRDMLDAQIETVARAQDKNALLQQERQYIASSYDAQIAIAKLEGNTAKQEELKAQRQKELLDNELTQLQNLSDEQSAQYGLHQQQEANADSAEDKNKYEAESRKNLKSQYEYQIPIAFHSMNYI